VVRVWTGNVAAEVEIVALIQPRFHTRLPTARLCQKALPRLHKYSSRCAGGPHRRDTAGRQCRCGGVAE
jgi:hypothetical protein